MSKKQKNKEINIFKAFTLAEMMVILTVLSVVMAATMPVITAKQKLTDGKLSSVSGGSSGDANFQRNDDYESISYSGDFIAINMQPSEAKELQTARMLIKSRNSVGIQYASHVGFFSHNSGTMPAGRIAMGDGTNANIAIGDNAMYANRPLSTANLKDNVAIGYYAQEMFSSSASSSQLYGNVGIGYKANSRILSNTVKNDTVEIGYGGLGALVDIYKDNTNLNQNSVSVNSRVLGILSNGGGPNEILIGLGTSDGAAGGRWATAIGYYAKAQSGPGGIAIGSYSQATMSNSVSIGTYAMYAASGHISGSKTPTDGQIAIGYGAMYDSNIYTSVAIGQEVFAYTYGANSITGMTPAKSNIAIGSFAGYALSGSSHGNIFLGIDSGRSAKDVKNVICIGTYSCGGMQKVKGGIFIGSRAGSGVEVEALRSYIGTDDAIFYHSPNSGKVINNHGWNPTGDTDYAQMVFAPNLGNLSSSVIWLNAGKVYGPATTMATYSDRRLKENIRLTSSSVKDFRKLNVYEYNFKNDKEKTNQIGVIAQELKKVYPNAVVNMPNSKYLGVNGDWLLYSAIKAVKDLDESIEALRKEIYVYIEEYKELAIRVVKLEKEVKMLEKENKILVKSINVAYKKAKENANR